ncbi:hypothetical protein GARC_4895 [Paraglaciecola arctica BSs20135]|uniref:Uncharacterized protein n=1 Tax=Paraglaciecola arctica BSs20135 TaxID=493475 RepID=K6YUK3_9ALTE|nr:hypothetical protein GARC_4895 [Paraglaciecola arctica BSs20135]
MNGTKIKTLFAVNQHLTSGILIGNRLTSRGYQMSIRVST